MAKIGQVRFFLFILAKTKTSFPETAQKNVVEEEGSQILAVVTEQTWS